jgi:FMN phosphatase YigB (HAD superfamily)
VFRAVIFDLGKVIIPFDFERGYAAMSSFCHYPVGEIPARIRSTDLVRRFESGMLEPEEFVSQLSTLLELKIGYQEFCRMWSSVFLPETLIPDSLVTGLRSRYRVLLMSNTNAIHFSMIRENYPVIGYFHDWILSYEVGAMKPAPEIYRQAIARSRCRPQEIFFTDDMAENVAAAREHGIDAVQFESLSQLEGELRARGIEW